MGESRGLFNYVTSFFRSYCSSTTSMFGTKYFQEKMLSSGSGFVFIDFHHSWGPFSFNTHNHIGIIATNITIKNVSMCVYKMMVVFQTKMFENFIHRTSFGTVEFWTLDWFIRTDFFMISSILERKKNFFFF